MLGTIVLVVLVIFLFLRRFVATAIPTLSLPVSLIGAVSLLWAFGYTLDNISLLGLTLAVGLVVDDAIVMLENIMRHVENGVPPFQAALRGSREVGFTIISISSSLVAVFIPIFFMPGVIGLLFHEFAVIVALAIVVSAFVSLTLVPMLASRFLSDEAHKKRAGRASCARSSAASTRCSAATRARSTWRCATAASCCCVALLTFVATAWLFVDDPEGLLPRGGHRPDQRSRPRPPRTPRSRRWSRCRTGSPTIMRADPNVADRQLVQRRRPGAQNTGRLFVNLKPRGERQPMKQVVEGLRKQAARGAGHHRLHAADPEPAARRPPEQGAVPVHPAERAGRRAQRLGAASCRSRCAPTRCSATSPATRSCAACRRR